MTSNFLQLFILLNARLKNILRGWLLVLGLKECLVECATMSVKSEVKGRHIWTFLPNSDFTVSCVWNGKFPHWIGSAFMRAPKPLQAIGLAWRTRALRARAQITCRTYRLMPLPTAAATACRRRRTCHPHQLARRATSSTMPARSSSTAVMSKNDPRLTTSN